jgi:hypothetical protein
VRSARGRLTDAAARASEFQIFDTQPIYDSGEKKGLPIPTSEWRGIKRLGRRDRAAIEWLQPYKGWDPRFAGRTQIGPARLVLSEINGLNNIDKHRQLHLIRQFVSAVPIPNFLPQYGFRSHPAFRVPLEPNAYVDRWTFTTPPPPEHMHMHRGVYEAVALVQGSERIQVLPWLRGTIAVTWRTISRFSNRFPPLDEPIDIDALLRWP